jgi:hypothetical protein
MTSKEEAVSVYLFQQQFVSWLLTLLEKSTPIGAGLVKSKSKKEQEQIHVFCLDFASALLANIFNSNKVLDLLEQSRATL